LRFYHKLQRYITENLDPNQIGFVKGQSPQENIFLLIQKIKESKLDEEGGCRGRERKNGGT
jgi:hypothetical protein